jgi:hypothetical protein
VLWFRREKSVKIAERGELEEYAGICCEGLEHAVDVGDGLLHDLGDVMVSHHLFEEET